MITCPNPKCKKKIEDPILVTVRSITPPKQYDACPYCFAELEQDSTEENERSKPTSEKINDEKNESTTDLSMNTGIEKEIDSGPKFFQKVKSLISNNSEPKLKESIEKSIENKGSESSECPETFGYLANRPKDAPIPQECLSCQKMVDCMLSPRE